MMERENDFGQPIGWAVPGWRGAQAIPQKMMAGQYCDVVPLTMDVTEELFDAYAKDTAGALWTYMPAGPFADGAEFANWANWACKSQDPMFYAIIDKRQKRAIGVASYLRINAADGTAEVGYIAFSPLLQRTRMATEAMFLMMRQLFEELGYRRYEWKCDALNAASQAAARRLGFTYEGTFRQALVYKGRNRDTAWFSVIDKDWPALKEGFERWLAPGNFDEQGQQLTPLHVAAASAATP